MNGISLRATALIAALVLGAGSAAAHSIEKKGIQIIHPWTKPADGGSTVAFPTISNEGKKQLTLTKIETPVAQRVELRRKNAVVTQVKIPPGDIVAFDGADYSVTLVGLKQPLKDGMNFPATYHFGHDKIDLKMVVGEKTDLPVDGSKVNVSHDAIPAIGWPKMTMDMALLEGARVRGVKPGDPAWLVFAIGPDGVYAVKEIAPKSGPKPAAPAGAVLTEGVVNTLP